MTTWLIVAACALAALIVVIVFNGLVRSRNRVREAWADIDAQLQRRHDLIPNLVSAVKGYARHERETFATVTDARAQAEAARTQGPQAAGDAEGTLSGALRSLLAVAENYPQLRASDNFLNLQEQLGDIEAQIAAARRIYNGNVQVFNTRCRSFPGILLAAPLGFSPREFFEIADRAERRVPEVAF